MRRYFGHGTEPRIPSPAPLVWMLLGMLILAAAYQLGVWHGARWP